MKIAGMIIQIIGIIAVLVGIGLEIWRRARIGILLITAGSLLFAVGKKLGVS